MFSCLNLAEQSVPTILQHNHDFLSPILRWQRLALAAAVSTRAQVTIVGKPGRQAWARVAIRDIHTAVPDIQ